MRAALTMTGRACPRLGGERRHFRVSPQASELWTHLDRGDNNEMSTSARYEAFWVPGLEHDIDQAESLTAALKWLSDAESVYEGVGVIVMYAKKMSQNDPLLRAASHRWDFVSRASRRPHGQGPVLCIWPPNAQVLELGEQFALDNALCVVAGRYDIGGWIAKANAECLLPEYSTTVATPRLADDVADAINSMLLFGGNNDFLGGGEKEDAIRTLKSLIHRDDRPTPAVLEKYIVASGDTSAEGSQRIRRWYEEILDGKSHRDSRGRIIR